MEFTIELNPVTKKNSSRIVVNRRTGRPMIVPSKKYSDYEQMCRPYIPELHIDYPINIEAHYYREDRRRCDLCNLHEALCDVLVKWGFVKDDNHSIIVSLDGSRVHYDRINPRTEVKVTRYEEKTN